MLWILRTPCLFTCLLGREHPPVWSESVLLRNEDAFSVVNTPTGLLKYWVRTLGMVDTHPTAFDICCLMAIVFIVQDDCAVLLTRPGPALCSQGPRMSVCKYVCGWMCAKTVGLCVRGVAIASLCTHRCDPVLRNVCSDNRQQL